MVNFEKELQAIKARNAHVESEKSWETSFTRRCSIALITYITASFFLYFIGAQDSLLISLIPTVGYLFSTMSLPPIKRIWICCLLKRLEKRR